VFLPYYNVAIEAFKIDGYPRGTVAETRDSAEHDLFTPENIEHTLGNLLPSLFEAVQNNSIGCAPLVLSSCLLAFLWLLDEEGVSAFCVIIPLCNLLFIIIIYVVVKNYIQVKIILT